MKKILFVLCNKMSARIFFETDLAKNFLNNDNIHFKCVTVEYNESQYYKKYIGSKIIDSREIYKKSAFLDIFKRKIKLYIYRTLTYRFNDLNAFSSHKIKKNFSFKRKMRELKAGNVCLSFFGWPFCKSKIIYAIFKKIYFNHKILSETCTYDFLFTFNPDIVVVFHVQNVMARDFITFSKNINIPVVGVIGSWDQPTTKGPIYQNLDAYIVQNKCMANELSHYHGIHKEILKVTGWPQMDIYFDQSLFKKRDEFLDELKFPRDSKIVLFAAYSKRLGAHEADILDYLYKRFTNDFYGKNIVLVVRPHPKDNEWRDRFFNYQYYGKILVQSAEYGDLSKLSNFLLHSDVVICTNGSITLDAIAFNKDVVNIAFDGCLSVDSNDSVKLLYNMDHYRKIVESNSVFLAQSFTELDSHIVNILQKSECVNSSVNYIRDTYLEPFDGYSVERMTNIIMEL